jgi:galactokinase
MSKEAERAKQAYLEYMEGSTAAFAPGRIEFLGNHLDYNGGLVLGAAIDAGIYALANPREDKVVRLFSESFADGVVETGLTKFSKQDGKKSWANYCLGVLKVMTDEGLAPSTGFSLTLATSLPISAGLSSSAALELATALAIAELANKKITLKDLVEICRKAENEFVGMPCGILDQATSAFGKKGHLVLIDCETESVSSLPMPAESRLWVIDSGIKHDLVDSHYATRNQECKDALRLIREINPSLTCLAQADEQLIGQADLPESARKRALHVVREQERVRSFRKGLEKKTGLRDLGRLLTDSHQSSCELFENSCTELDALVQSLIKHENVLGARLTGGGFGGAVLAWTTTEFQQTDADKIASSYESQFGRCPETHCFSPSRGAGIEDWKQAED